jgi:hypothetical protein
MNIRYLAIALLVAISASFAYMDLVPRVIISYNSPANHVDFEIRAYNFGDVAIGETLAVDESAAGTFNVTVPPLPAFSQYSYVRSVPCSGNELVSLTVDLDSNNSVSENNEVNGLNRTGTCNIDPPEFDVTGEVPYGPFYPGVPFNATLITHNVGQGPAGASVTEAYSVDGTFKYNVSALGAGAEEPYTFEASCTQGSDWNSGIWASNDKYWQVEQHDEWVGGGGASPINCTYYLFPSSPLYKPDLVINSYVPVGWENYDGDSADYVVQLEVRNIGLGPAEASHTSVQGDAFGIDELVNTTPLGPNESMFFNMTFTCADEREPLALMADALEEVLETNGTNNHALFYPQPCRE